MDEFKIGPVPTPWNKGKLVGQKTPLKLKEIGLSASGFKSLAERGNWRSSISVSTASCGLAICSSEGSRSLSRRAGRCTSDRGPTKDVATGAVQDHGADAERFIRVDQAVRSHV
jgi:hypothetical protein